MAHPMNHSRGRRGFTVVDALGLIAAGGAVMVLALPALSNPRENAMRQRDVAQIRSIMQACNYFAPDNDSRLPTPSLIDRNSMTVNVGPDGDVGLKNTTGAIMSTLIFLRMITPEITVSPVDRVGVRVMKDYSYDRPAGAAGQARFAQWDPSFKGTPWDHLSGHAPKTMSRDAVSNNSYAHIPIGGARREDWRLTFNSSMPVLSNRGPVFDIPDKVVTDSSDWRFVDGPTGTESATLGFYAPADRWSGLVAFGDASVRTYELPSNDIEVKYHIADKDGLRAVVDNFFVDEPWEGDAEKRKNALLRTFWRGIPLDAPFDAAYLRETSKGLFIDGAEPPAPPVVP